MSENVADKQTEQEAIDLTEMDKPSPGKYSGKMLKPENGVITDKRGKQIKTTTLFAEINATKTDGSPHVVKKIFRFDTRGKKALSADVEAVIQRQLTATERKKFDPAALIVGKETGLVITGSG